MIHALFLIDIDLRYAVCSGKKVQFHNIGYSSDLHIKYTLQLFSDILIMVIHFHVLQILLELFL